MRITVRVPATSANLGPGFDCLGLALDLWNEVTVDTDVEPGVSWEGEGADELPTDGSDMVSRAIRSVADGERAAGRADPLPGFRLTGVNRIPLERGLGSSAAAAVAGVAIARSLLGLALEPYTMAAGATLTEGHWDNASAAVYGGLTVVADGFVHRLDPDERLRPVVLVPPFTLPTKTARRALPDTVARADAVFNIGHAALVVAALTGDPDLLLVALHDRLHEDVRLDLAPGSRDAIERLRGEQIPACLSGAGPSILAFEREGHAPVPDLGAGWRAMYLAVARTGVEVVEG
jgi:homoserine kinase